MKSKKYFLYLLISLITFYLIHYKYVSAQTLESDNYKIKEGNLNMSSAAKEEGKTGIENTIGQTGSGVYTSDGFIVKAGFYNKDTSSPFIFGLSSSLIDFTSLMPNIPQNKSISIKVATGDAEGYKVSIVSQTPLKQSDSIFIANTFCNENKPCLVNKASLWSSDQVYGLGYNLIGDSIPIDFVNKDFFRPLPIKSKGQSASTIMSSNRKTVADQAQLTFKLNIPSQQTEGKYETTLEFITTPRY